MIVASLDFGVFDGKLAMLSFLDERDSQNSR